MRFSAPVFSLVFTVVYVALLALEYPAVGFYPLSGAWSVADLTATDGTVMHWFGLVAYAAGAAVLAGALVPWLGSARRFSVAEVGLARLTLLVVWLGMLACWGLLRGFFV